MNLDGVDSKKLFEKHVKTIMLWGGFITASLLVWTLLSSGDFSFLLTYSAFMRCFGLLLINYRMWGFKSAKGISVKTLELYAVVFATRLLSITRHQGYLPYDKTGSNYLLQLYTEFHWNNLLVFPLIYINYAIVL